MQCLRSQLPCKKSNYTETTMPKPYGEALENELPVGEKEKNRDSDTGRETTEALNK